MRPNLFGWVLLVTEYRLYIDYVDTGRLLALSRG